MGMSISRRAFLGSMAITGAGGAAGIRAQETNAVTVFEARRIVTMEPSMPHARFVATANGMILGVGQTLQELAPWTSGRTVKLEQRFARQVLFPGLIDPHIHPMQSSVMLNLPFIAPEDWALPNGNFPGTRSAQAWQARFSELLAASNANPFICWGHHELFHGPMDRNLLDRLAPDRQAVVWQRSFHEIIANSATLKAWGLDNKAAFDAAMAEAKADPNHGNLERGIFSESALMIPLGKLRADILEPRKVLHGAGLMRRMMQSHGVTTVSDMATGIFAGFDSEAKLIKAAFDSPDGSARVMLMPVAMQVAPEVDPVAWLETMRPRYASPRIRLDRRVKMLADGAFFAQNMRMNAPGYTDGHQGKWITEPPVLTAQFRRFWDAGFALHIHVNGDEGLDVVLDGLAALPQRPSQTVTLEHVGYSTEAQNRRIARMGLMVSAQPNYIRVLGETYGQHGLGVDRASVMNRLGSLERKGVPLGLHSDFNMAPIDPLYLAWIAANRITLEGKVEAPEERISVAKALRAVTIEAAQVIGMDTLVGSIAAGKRADFVALEGDPSIIDPGKLKDVHIAGLVFEGRIAG